MRLACAFSIAQVLARHHTPRPPDHIAKICGLPGGRELLRIDKVLKLTEEEKERLGKENFELMVEEPEDYIEPLAVIARIKFCFWSQMYNLACAVKWKLAGKKPRTIAAACMFFVMDKENFLQKDYYETFICQQLGVDRRSVKDTVKLV